MVLCRIGGEDIVEQGAWCFQNCFEDLKNLLLCVCYLVDFELLIYT